MGSRQFVIAANWKMYKSPVEAMNYLKEFKPHAQNLKGEKQVIFFVPAVDLWVVREELMGTEIGWGAQNCHFEKQGAFTGETSPQVLADISAPFALVGHSERRTLFNETDELTAKKVKALHEVGIQPMLCVGETLSEREGNQTEAVIRRQLRAGLSLRGENKPVMIAYEPVWAIGTGKVASPEQANEAHVILRDELKKIGGAVLADVTPILYGGSVKPDNAKEIKAQKEVDGFLVGGASLQVDSFWQLVNS